MPQTGSKNGEFIIKKEYEEWNVLRAAGQASIFVCLFDPLPIRESGGGLKGRQFPRQKDINRAGLAQGMRKNPYMLKKVKRS